MWRYILPRMAWSDLPPMLLVAAIGALLGAIYGAAHDQITYTLSPEYFTKLKFLQFADANFGLGDRVFAGTVGVLATWWVGLFCGWFLARRYLPGQTRPVAYRQIARGIACIFGSGILFGVLGYLLALAVVRADHLDFWAPILERLQIDDGPAFVRVAYIHNAGYLGGLVGLIAAFAMIRRGPDATRAG